MPDLKNGKNLKDIEKDIEILANIELSDNAIS